MCNFPFLNLVNEIVQCLDVQFKRTLLTECLFSTPAPILTFRVSARVFFSFSRHDLQLQIIKVPKLQKRAKESLIEIGTASVNCLCMRVCWFVSTTNIVGFYLYSNCCLMPTIFGFPSIIFMVIVKICSL